jgi:hypothetical protein
VRVRMRLGGCSGRQADSGRTGEAGCCAADVEGVIGAAEAAEAACPTAQSGASCACVPCASVHTSGGRELRRVRVASRRVGLVGVLWHGFHQPPSRRPEQREQLQWPFRLHLCGGGATTGAETARWRRVGTRVDWSCNRRGLRDSTALLIVYRCETGLLPGGALLSPHLQSASAVEVLPTAPIFHEQKLPNNHVNVRERMHTSETRWLEGSGLPGCIHLRVAL